MQKRKRTRRSPEQARERILDAAEKRLIEGGPEAVRVQLVARDLGITDPAIHHHFGNRQGLVEALLRRAGRRLKEDLSRLADPDPSKGHAPNLRTTVARMSETFEAKGHSRLALWLSLSGWRDRGSGMFRGLAESLHAARVRRARDRDVAPPRLDDTLHCVAMLALTMAAEPLMGDQMRRSVGLASDAAAKRRFESWLVRRFEILLA